jgi:uncharacterized protein YbjT (DUF2867 family)
MARSILVAGATGNQGGAVAERLLDGGWQVRALTRDPSKPAARALAERGAETVQGDLEDEESLRQALEGADAVFSVQNFWEHGAEREVRQGKALADAAMDAGVEHFVYSSVGSADRDTGISHFETKRQIEDHIRKLGLPATILRPVFLMENFEWPFYRPRILEGTLALPLPAGRKLQMVACRDVGMFAAIALERGPEMIGQAIEVAGEELSGPEAAEVFERVLGRPVQFVEAPLERIQAMNPEVGDMWAWLASDGYKADLDALRTMHPDPVTLEEWVRAGDWQGA